VCRWAGEDGSGPLVFGTPEDLFPYTYFVGPFTQRRYDMTPDGERFLMIGRGGVSEDAPGASQIVVVLDWFEELKRLVPTD